MLRKSEIVRAWSTEARDKNVTGLREDAFRPFLIDLESPVDVLRISCRRPVDALLLETPRQERRNPVFIENSGIVNVLPLAIQRPRAYT